MDGGKVFNDQESPAWLILCMVASPANLLKTRAQAEKTKHGNAGTKQNNREIGSTGKSRTRTLEPLGPTEAKK